MRALKNRAAYVFLSGFFKPVTMSMNGLLYSENSLNSWIHLAIYNIYRRI